MTASKRVVQKITEAAGYLMGNKIANSLYSPVFPIDFNFLLILMIFNSVLSMNGEPTQDRNVDYVKNICNLLWLAEYQCKGVVKSNMSNLYSGVSFGQFLPFQ